MSSEVQSKAQNAWNVQQSPETDATNSNNTNINTNTVQEKLSSLGIPSAPIRRKKKKKKKKTLRSPGFGFFYGSCDHGLKPGSNSLRQTAWERYNNDKHLKKNISKMKSTFSTQPKIPYHIKLKKRQRILATIKAMPDPISRAMQAASQLRMKINAIAATETINDSEEKKSIIITKIISAVRQVTDKWSIPRVHVSRLWMEAVLPESDGISRTRWDQFAHVLKRECRSNIKNQELLAAYLERRCVSNEEMSAEEVGALWKVAILSGAIHEDIVFGWHAGILGAIRIVAAVEMSAEKRAALREKMKSFISWLQKREDSIAAPTIAAIPKLALDKVKIVDQVQSTVRSRPKPPLKPRNPKSNGGPRTQKLKPKPQTAR